MGAIRSAAASSSVRAAGDNSAASAGRTPSACNELERVDPYDPLKTGDVHSSALSYNTTTVYITKLRRLEEMVWSVDAVVGMVILGQRPEAEIKFRDTIGGSKTYSTTFAFPRVSRAFIP